MIKILFLYIFYFVSTSAIAIPNDPVLIDYNLSGSGKVPYFEPRRLDLLVEQPYLLVINNPFPDAINVTFGDMGKFIHTHYLKGVPGMSQSSIMVPANGKVTWILDINQPGTFEIFAFNMGMGQKGLPSIIHVQAKTTQVQYSAEELEHFERLHQQLQQSNKDKAENIEKQTVELGNKNSVEPLKMSQRPRLLGGRPD